MEKFRTSEGEILVPGIFVYLFLEMKFFDE
jgi:hypothetical protein